MTLRSRAHAAQRLDAYLDSLAGRGTLKEFNRSYRRGQMAATLRGEGFMKVATAWLRRRSSRFSRHR